MATTSARVDGNKIIAVWSFAPAAAPASFDVTITEECDDGQRPATTSEPIRLERRESATVDWVATITLSKAVDDRTLIVRASEGAAIEIGEVTRSQGTRSTADPVDELIDLRNLLAQQPDHGRAILARLMPSANPDELRAAVDDEIELAIEARKTRTTWPFTFISEPKVDDAKLAAFARAYKVVKPEKAQVEDQLFQTKEDWQRYVTAGGAVSWQLGGDVDRPLSKDLKNRAQDMTYEVRDAEVVDGSISVALFADVGNGLYASRAIAKQIVDSGLPYAFHLGDVYYGGSKKEFAKYFDEPLSPMFDRTELFMITGNHEMFARGEHFNKMICRKHDDHPARQRQKAESFRLRGPGFQIIGLDTMFVGWNSGHVRVHDYADEDRLALLRGWLRERPGDLTILLTTNEAWDKGSKQPTRLYDSLRGTISGNVDLWFWGNVHYAALYDMWPFADTGSPLRRMVTSCIGHGGYPFYTESVVAGLPGGLMCRWLETKSRFWPDTSLRPDLGLNGWCCLKLTRESGAWEILLTYIDWVGRARLRARLGRKDGGGIYFKSVEESEIATVGAEPTWHSRPLGSFP